MLPFLSSFFRIMISRFIHVVACMNTSFVFIANLFHCMGISHFIKSLVNGRLGQFDLGSNPDLTVISLVTMGKLREMKQE